MALTKTDLTPIAQRRIDKFSTKNAGMYNVTNLVYPEEISTAPDMQHYVTFYINVRGKSKFRKDNPNQILGQLKIDENRTDPNKISGAAIAGAVGMAAVAGMAMGKTLGSAAFANAKAGGASTMSAGVSGLGAMAGTGIAVGVTTGIIASMIIEPDTTYRIKDCITLHVSQSPSAHYGVDYNTHDLGALLGTMGGGSSIVDSAIGATTTEALRALALGAASVPGSLLSGQTVKGAVETTTKQSLNPYREVLFKSVGFRKFAFDYKFMPKSQAETDAIQKIIHTFKYHMHPELSAGGMYYIHPSEFNIQHYFGGKENGYVAKISTCVLDDMHVDYGGNEGLTSFKDGAPVEIGLRLIFQELETLTKERIEQGY